MATALAQLQADLVALYEEHHDALSQSDHYEDAGPGVAIYDEILTEVKTHEKAIKNLARLVSQQISQCVLIVLTPHASGAG